MRKLLSLLAFMAAFASHAQLSEPPPAKLKIVDPSKTCMIKNHLYPTPQEKLNLDGKDYYVCCAPCKRAITMDPANRLTKDPVTGEEIDKSKALVAADSKNKTYYFKDKKTFQRHLDKSKARMAESPAK